MKKKKPEFAKLVYFITESGLLKRLPRSGWQVAGIKNAESVADHSFRCAVIGYLLAKMEKADVYKVLLMTLFGDIHEARITDIHKLAQVYFDLKSAEKRSFSDQVVSLPQPVKKELKSSEKEYHTQKSSESIIARDADILECLIQAKEYYEQGYTQAQKLMKKAPVHLRTKSARKLWQAAKKSDLNEWWFNISKFYR